MDKIDLFFFGLFAGIVSGVIIVEPLAFNKGALAQKNGQLTWHTNSGTNVSFTKNK